jgi:hypothetical protein
VPAAHAPTTLFFLEESPLSGSADAM